MMSDEFDKVIARVYLKDHSCNLHAPLFDTSYRKHFQTIRASSMSISGVIDMRVKRNYRLHKIQAIFLSHIPLLHIHVFSFFYYNLLLQEVYFLCIPPNFYNILSS